MVMIFHRIHILQLCYFDYILPLNICSHQTWRFWWILRVHTINSLNIFCLWPSSQPCRFLYLWGSSVVVVQKLVECSTLRHRMNLFETSNYLIDITWTFLQYLWDRAIYLSIWFISLTGFTGMTLQRESMMIILKMIITIRIISSLAWC